MNSAHHQSYYPLGYGISVMETTNSLIQKPLTNGATILIVGLMEYGQSKSFCEIA